MLHKIVKKCISCGKPYKSPPAAKRKYCSYKCYWRCKIGERISPDTEFKKGCGGEKSYNWNGGTRIDKDGYINIFSPKHPFATKNNCVLEHRLVAEKCLNRYLTTNECVHHINEIRTDNRPENLFVFPTHREHFIFHKPKNKRTLISNL